MKTNFDHDAKTDADPKDVDRVQDPADTISILPIHGMVAFPQSKLPLAISGESAQLIKKAVDSDRPVGLLAVKDSDVEDPTPQQLYEVGTIARVLHVHRNESGQLVALVRGSHRFRVIDWLAHDDHLIARVEKTPESIEQSLESEVLQQKLKELLQEMLALVPNVPDEVRAAMARVEDPMRLIHMAAANSNMSLEESQSLLEMDSAEDKIRSLLTHLTHEIEKLKIGRKISGEIREKMDKSKREYYLRQQMEALKKELGEEDAATQGDDAEDLRQKVEASPMTDEARTQALRELDRLNSMSPQAPEHSMIRNYLDWLLDLPWANMDDEQSDISQARRMLDEDHYGLEDVKTRLVEYMAVRSLIRERELKTAPDQPNGAGGVILCLAGPPGVGKTSLGRSVARALGRSFTRMSLGGMRDEAEIRGHRRTYIGAMPGRIMQAIKRAGTRNPVFMLDEIDKLGAGWHGDPSSALLEVLDPAQNNTFRDHYLDVDFDLSDVIFIATANQLDTIPGPLRDRMEIVSLEGYTEQEKLQIAKWHLVPRQLQAHGLETDEVTFMDDAILKIIANYTRESGVRNLERHIAAICRKGIVQLSENGWGHVVVTDKMVRDYLKKEHFDSEASESIQMPGIATGLAVTSVGGDILYVEATRMPGKGGLKLTGQLGDVMKESAQIAYSFIRSKADRLGIDSEQFEQTDVHVHVPSGALPKDGPSAGVAMVMALTSLFTGNRVRSDVGITGEITLRGRVLPVGGIKMKVLAAHRAGLKKVILPKRNERDLDDIPEEVTGAMQFITIDRLDEVFPAALTQERLPLLEDSASWLQAASNTAVSQAYPVSAASSDVHHVRQATPEDAERFLE